MNITSSLCPYSIARSYPDALKKAAENFGFPGLSVEGLIETLATDDVDIEELEDMIAKEICKFVPEHLLPIT
jgi:hypothetical protein